MRRLLVLMVMFGLLFVTFNCQKKQKPVAEQQIEQPAVVDTTAVSADTTQVQ